MKIHYKTRRREKFPAMGAVAVAVMEHTGMRAYIDSMCVYDRARRGVSPGTAVEIMAAVILGYRCKAPAARSASVTPQRKDMKCRGQGINDNDNPHNENAGDSFQSPRLNAYSVQLSVMVLCIHFFFCNTSFFKSYIKHFIKHLWQG